MRKKFAKSHLPRPVKLSDAISAVYGKVQPLRHTSQRDRIFARLGISVSLRGTYNPGFPQSGGEEERVAFGFELDLDFVADRLDSGD